LINYQDRRLPEIRGREAPRRWKKGGATFDRRAMSDQQQSGDFGQQGFSSATY
jgi:hypothetical protein